MNQVETIRLSMRFGTDGMQRKFHISHHLLRKTIANYPHTTLSSSPESLSPGLLPGCHINLIW